MIIRNMVKVSFLLSVNKLDEIELLLHGLDLGYLIDIMAVSTSSRAHFTDSVRWRLGRFKCFSFCFNTIRKMTSAGATC